VGWEKGKKEKRKKEVELARCGMSRTQENMTSPPQHSHPLEVSLNPKERKKIGIFERGEKAK